MTESLPTTSHLVGLAHGAAALPVEPNVPQSVISDDQELNCLERARAMILTQSDALTRTAQLLDTQFLTAVEVIRRCRGRLVVGGMGKSGLIGRKIAATMSLTGTPAFFLHPSEARHGDLGMVTPDDAILLVSRSGETEELVSLLGPIKELGIPLVAIVGSPQCTLARFADVVLDASIEREACPLNLAPTTSSLVALAMGDALAVTLSRSRGFETQDFVRIHPGGNRGRQLKTRVSDVMRKSDLPFVPKEMPLCDIIVHMTAGRCGLAIVQEQDGSLAGIITDGDLRRAFQRSGEPTQLHACDLMTRRPVVIRDDALIGEAEDLMRQKRIKALLAVDASGAVRGIVDVFVNR